MYFTCPVSINITSFFVNIKNNDEISITVAAGDEDNN